MQLKERVMWLIRWLWTWPERSEAWAYRKTAEWFVRHGVPRSAFKDLPPKEEP